MTRSSRRAALVGAAVLVQAALVPIAVYPSLSARLTGAEYLFAVEPVDPIDPFRGAYVALAYPDLLPAEPREGRRTEVGTVYVPLSRVGALWRGGALSTQPPASGPFLRCEFDGWQQRCGIESLFVPQDEAARLERELAAGDAVARVRVDDRGNAAVVAVEPGPTTASDG